MIWIPVVGIYADIDVYASVVAYADLLKQRGEEVKTYIPFAPNYSVPEELRAPEWEQAEFGLRPGDGAIILDISIPEIINRRVPTEQILELIDHHPGYEEYWQEQIGEREMIEKIGAVATIVFEKWGEAEMLPRTAKLLMSAILDNTLNFTATNTTERDREAARKLAEIAGTTVEDFTKWYFAKVSEQILANPGGALLEDCKVIRVPAVPGEVAFGQLTIWDAEDLKKQPERIAEAMANKSKNWIVNIRCISENKNYILMEMENLEGVLEKLPELKQEEKWWTTDKVYLRKQLIGMMQG